MRDAARVALQTRRAALVGEDRRAADSAIVARLRDLVARWAPRVLAGYWPMRDEPDLRAALAQWHGEGVVVALPRVAARASPLEFGRWSPDTTLAEGPFGTRHPQPHEPLEPDLLVLPCLGFDPRCHRLGYGGGYYDRTLAALPGARAVGVAYDDCEIVGFDAQPHDRPLDAIVTERRVLLRSAAG